MNFLSIFVALHSKSESSYNTMKRFVRNIARVILNTGMEQERLVTSREEATKLLTDLNIADSRTFARHAEIVLNGTAHSAPLTGKVEAIVIDLFCSG